MSWGLIQLALADERRRLLDLLEQRSVILGVQLFGSTLPVLGEPEHGDRCTGPGCAQCEAIRRFRARTPTKGTR